MTTTIAAITARKQHQCDTAQYEHHIIAPGHRYLRHVAFPDDDANGSDRPWVLRECIACAEGRNGHTGLLIGGACATFCCGDVPCARPFKHDGDHSCNRCVHRETPFPPSEPAPDGLAGVAAGTGVGRGAPEAPGT